MRADRRRVLLPIAAAGGVTHSQLPRAPASLPSPLFTQDGTIPAACAAESGCILTPSISRASRVSLSSSVCSRSRHSQRRG